MSGLPPDAPPGLRAALAEREARITGHRREGARAYARGDAADGPVFARWSGDAAHRTVLAHEAAVRDAVGADGVLRSPPVLARGDGWLLERAVASEPLAGAAAIAAVVEAAAALAGRALPEPVRGAAPEGRLRAARRRVRSLRTPVGRDLLAARRVLRAGSLPPVTSHGDFHVGNLLMEGGRPWVVDWELLGRRPLGFDLMRLWSSLEGPDDRDRLFEAAVAAVGERRRVELLELRYVLLVRAIVDKLVPSAEFNADPAGARVLLALLPEVRAAARVR